MLFFYNSNDLWRTIDDRNIIPNIFSLLKGTIRVGHASHSKEFRNNREPHETKYSFLLLAKAILNVFLISK